VTADDTKIRIRINRPLHLTTKIKT